MKKKIVQPEAKPLPVLQTDAKSSISPDEAKSLAEHLQLAAYKGKNMATETRSFGPEIFFNFYDATGWAENYVCESEESDKWELTKLEIKLMPSGGYRVGGMLEKKV
jgi:hypothetical protein